MIVDQKEEFKKLLAMEGNIRSHESLIKELQDEIRPLSEYEFLLFLQNALALSTDVVARDNDPFFQDLLSPSRQIPYLIDLYYSIDNNSGNYIITLQRWSRIKHLLDEIERTYVANVVFSEVIHNVEDYNKAILASNAHKDFFTNIDLVFIEQIIDKIERNIGPYNSIIQKQFSFSLGDALTFILYVASRFSDNKCEEFYYSDFLIDCLSQDAVDSIISFFQYSPETLKGKTLYYASQQHYLNYPLIKIGDKYMCASARFLWSALYRRLDKFLTETIPDNYKKNKAIAAEKKVLMLFKKLFGNKARYYTSYSADGVSEQDILVIYKKNYFIIEVKDIAFREPFRNPVKGYDRIKGDFENAIQKGYEQCLRVENAIWDNDHWTLIDADDFKNRIAEIDTRDVANTFSIVVTSYRYGSIQTDLSRLLKRKDETALFPWSVSIDDLENFILLLIKKSKYKAIDDFIQFLVAREGYHGRILCADELELCGWFMCNKQTFIDCSSSEIELQTRPDMSDIFDAYYEIGLGFDDELDIDAKKQRLLRQYANDFYVGEE